jgi:hypothetical protein
MNTSIEEAKRRLVADVVGVRPRGFEGRPEEYKFVASRDEGLGLPRNKETGSDRLKLAAAHWVACVFHIEMSLRERRSSCRAMEGFAQVSREAKCIEAENVCQNQP